MSIFQEILHPAIDLCQTQGSAFDTIHCINTLPYNIAVSTLILILPALIWLIWGTGSGKSKTPRLLKANYWFFFALLVIQTAIFLGLYWFPFLLKLFE